MTREEKIKRLKALKARCERLIVSSNRGPDEWRKDAEALDLALTALRTPTREMDDEFGKYKKFKEYFDDLYGKGLEVENWHMNGETIPFDDFYESACEYAEL